MPDTTIDSRYSSPGATATPWATGRDVLAAAEICWVTTVRPDGRPHCTPVVAVWVDGAVYFSTGTEERKYRNLEHNRSVLVTTGTNLWAEGLDIVVEGEAEHVTDMDELRAAAAAFFDKYGEVWKFTAEDGHFRHPSGRHFAEVFAVRPVTAFGYGRGEQYTQTRWRFGV